MPEPTPTSTNRRDPFSGASLRDMQARGATYSAGELMTIASGAHPQYPLDAHLRSVLVTYFGAPMLEPISCAGPCDAERDGVWVLTIASNGVRTASLRCLICGAECRKVGADKVAPGLPIYGDRSLSAHPCERCGNRGGTELHHWAPRHLFDDADDWPMGWLCRPCHVRWHAVVTPEMARRKAS